jgi:hypothetical protein
MATARLGHANLLLRDHDVAWHATDLIGSGSRRTATGSLLRSKNRSAITLESRITDHRLLTY